MLTRDEFHAAEQRITSAWHKGDYSDAHAEIGKILRHGSAEMKAEALYLSGLIKQDTANLDEAQQDWTKALTYSASGTFLQQNLEYEIGHVLEQKGCPDQALDWYRLALHTCAVGDEFAADSVLAAFLRINGEDISEPDRTVIEVAVRKSWRVLEVPGDPDLTDLPRTITRLSEHLSKSVEQIVKNSE